jgi:hypothetical protein
MRDGGLLDRDSGFEVADANASFVSREHVQQLQAHRMREVLEVRRNRRRFPVRAAGSRADIAASVAELPVHYRKRSAHAGNVAVY